MTLLPAKDWTTQYGAGVVRSYCGRLDNYVVLTSPSAWAAVRSQFDHNPRGLEFVTSQEESYNDALLRKLPRAAYVLGIGGGKALDAAKYVTWRREAKLITVPTVVSTGSIFQPGFPMRRNGKMYSVRDAAVPECVLFDTDVIGAAPPHMNAAGMAECVCWLGCLASWQWWCEQGLGGVSWDESVAHQVEYWVHDRVQRYAGDVDGAGRPGPVAIQVCAELNRERYDLPDVVLKASHSLDHIFDNTFTWVHGRGLLHGEAVALGTLMSCVLYDSRFEDAKSSFDRCRTRYLPVQIGCTWAQVRSALDAVPENSDHLKWNRTSLHDRQLDDVAFRAMIDRINPAESP